MGYKALELNGKVAVVVGGTSGIGQAIAHGLAEAGADVVATSRRMEAVEPVAAEIESRGRRSLRITSDVADRDSIERLLESTVKEFGKVDILVNSAGKTKRTPTLELAESEWNDILDTNLTGTLRTCQIFGRHMVAREYGRIINIASIASFLALYEVSAYGASKAGVAMLTRQLAIELAPRGVTGNAIAPGGCTTPLNRKLLEGTERGREFLIRTPMKRFGKVEELAGAAGFLASDAAGLVTGEGVAGGGGVFLGGVEP